MHATTSPRSLGGPRLPAGLSLAASFALLALGLVAFFVATARMDPDRVGDIGLVAEAGYVYWVGVLCVVAVFTVTVVRTPYRTVVLATSLLTLLFMIYGLASVTESLPRFQVAWLHAGFIEYISRTGRVLPTLDARYSWPGAFSLGAFADSVAGVNSAVTLIRWAPLAFSVAYLTPLWAITASLTSDVRVRWLTLWIFAIGNWVGQDYLSPQAVAYLLFLVILMILLRWFRTPDPGYRIDGPAKGRSLPRRALDGVLKVSRSTDELPSTPAPATTRVALVLLVIALYSACVISHQLTPVFLLGLVTLLVLTRRLALRFIPLIFGALFVAWLSWGAVAFWSGHLSVIAGGFAKTGSNVSANVSTRFNAASTGRTLVLFTRIIMAAGIMFLAAVGVFLRRTRGHIDLTAILGAIAPFPVVLVQAYGGEALLRAYLCSLPFLALLASYALVAATRRSGLRVPSWVDQDGDAVRHRRRRGRLPVPVWLLISVVSIVGLVGSVTVRYGNERFEQVRVGDLRAVNAFYTVAKPGDTIVALNANLPWRYKDVDLYNYVAADDTSPITNVRELDALVARSPHTKPTYVVFAPGEEAYGETWLGLPKGWMQRLETALNRSSQYHVVYANGDARLYALEKGAL